MEAESGEILVDLSLVPISIDPDSTRPELFISQCVRYSSRFSMTDPMVSEEQQCDVSLQRGVGCQTLPVRLTESTQMLHSTPSMTGLESSMEMQQWHSAFHIGPESFSPLACPGKV